MLRLTPSGFINSLTEPQWGRLLREFQETHAVKLPSFLDSRLTRLAQEGLARFSFAPLDASPHYRWEVSSGPAGRQLMFLCTHPDFLDLLSRLSGYPRYMMCGGGIYRLITEKGHYIHWHDDGPWPEDWPVKIGVSLSVALNQELFEGGRFQIRRKNSTQIIREIPNVKAGDAILFRTSTEMEHCNTPMKGRAAKCAFVCQLRGCP